MNGTSPDDTQPATVPLPDLARAGPAPSAPFRFETGQATDAGCRRSVNEDSVMAHPEAGLWAVADGMGGHSAGDFASQAIVAALETILPAETPAALMGQVTARLAEANDRIRRHARTLDGAQVGATVAALIVHGQDYACLWSGDSRVYLLRAGRMVQQTRDHSEARMLLESGAITEGQAANWPRRNVITRAIGVAESPETEIVGGRVAAGDVFVLCSDGLTEHLSDDEIAELAGRLPAQEACDALIALTLERGARDNVSVVVTRCLPDPQLDRALMDDMVAPIARSDGEPE